MKNLVFSLGLTAAATALWLTAQPADPPRRIGENRAPAVQPAPTPVATFTTGRSVTSAPGTITVTAMFVSNATGLVAISPRPGPQLSISCDEESCSARGWNGSIDDAKAMLERIANRSVRIEVSVDQRCQAQRETIPVREPLVAGLEHQVR
jgi:hypothetical protein